jgi:glycine C-acetyltransferase
VPSTNHRLLHKSTEELFDFYYQIRNPQRAAQLRFADRARLANELITTSTEKQLYFYRREIQPQEGRVEVLDPRTGEKTPMINLASNDYLNFTQHPAVVRAGQEALALYGAGAGSVPMLSGTFDVHKELERRLASFLGYEACLTFSSGYASNYGVLRAMLQQNDVAILDTLVHGSIIDGCSHARKLFFLHNDLQSLEIALKKAAGAVNRLIVIDGVYSMDGDLARYDEILTLAAQYDAQIMIDDAHGVGVMGPLGRGTQHHFHRGATADLMTGSFGKALAGIGGFVCGNTDTIRLLEMSHRPFLFSSSLPPAVAASILREIDLLERGDEALRILWSNTAMMAEGLRALGFNLGDSSTPILPIMIPDERKAMAMCERLGQEKIFVSPIIYPIVKKNKSRLRVSITAGLAAEDLRYCLGKFREVGKRLDLI